MTTLTQAKLKVTKASSGVALSKSLVGPVKLHVVNISETCRVFPAYFKNGGQTRHGEYPRY